MKFTIRAMSGHMSITLDESIGSTTRADIARQWRHLRTDAAAEASDHLHLAVGTAHDPVAPGARVLAARDPAHAPDLLASQVTLTGLRTLAGSALLFHGAGLAADDGRVVALVGPSGRDKTTAARALGRTLGYVSDETVAFRPDLSVIAYPKPLSIGHRPGVKALSAPDELGMRVAPQPLRLGALVLLDRRTEHIEPRVEEVALGDALGELVEQSSAFPRLPRPLRTLVDVISATGGVRRVVYRDAEHLDALVAEVLAATPAFEPPAGAVADVAERPSAPSSPAHVGRGPFVDALPIDDRLAILTETRLHILDGIGPELWRQADDVSLVELGDRVRRRLGEPPAGVDLSRAIDDAVTALEQAALLRRG